MIEFFSENLSTILISLVIAFLMGLAVYSLIRGKKNGKGCAGCSGCSHSAKDSHKHTVESPCQCSGKHTH